MRLLLFPTANLVLVGSPHYFQFAFMLNCSFFAIINIYAIAPLPHRESSSCGVPPLFPIRLYVKLLILRNYKLLCDCSSSPLRISFLWGPLILFSPTGANRWFEPYFKYKKCHYMWHFGAPSRVSAFRKIAPMGNFLAANGRHNHHILYFTITLFSDDVSVRLRQERTVGSSPA